VAKAFGGKAEITHAAALGQHHDRLIADGGEGDVGDRVAAPRACNRFR
jgi:hypothetical protein